MKFDTVIFFENASIKLKFHKEMYKTTDTLHEEQYTFFIISRSVLLRMTKLNGILTEIYKVYISCSMTLFQKIAPFMRWCTTKLYGQTFQTTKGRL
jgi:hypothetical protein